MTKPAAIRRLLSVGSILADIRIEVPSLPPRGGDVFGSTAAVTAGGGFNILAAAARQGLPTLFAGRHGHGPYGTRIRQELAHEGIAILLPPTEDADSGVCVVLVEPDGERTFVTSPGVEASLGSRELSQVPLASGDAVFVSGYDLCYPELGPAIAAWVATMPERVWLVVDPGPLVAEIPPGILAGVMLRTSIWTMNRREASHLADSPYIAQVARRVLPRLSPDALLVVRDGAAGAYLCSANVSPVSIPAPAVAAIDSTGAGDTHTGVLAASLASGLAPAAAVRRANAAAAISVTRPGPATSPGREELDHFLAADADRFPETPGRSLHDADHD